MNTAAKHDQGKLRLSLVPTEAIRAIARVREYGSNKYNSTDNWQYVEPERYIDAAYRHLLAMVDNPQSIDGESGLPHYAHLACNAAFLCEIYEYQKQFIDQRNVHFAEKHWIGRR